MKLRLISPDSNSESSTTTPLAGAPFGFDPNIPANSHLTNPKPPELPPERADLAVPHGAPKASDSAAALAKPVPRESQNRSDEEQAAPLIDLGRWLRESPPWLLSAVLHMLALITLGLLLRGVSSEAPISLEATYAEDIGEQLIDDTLDLASLTDLSLDEMALTPDTLPPVEDPFATPDVAVVSPLGTHAASETPSTSIGMALTGREPGMKKALLRAYGGTVSTETAVMNGLKWLARNQQRNGMWSLKGPYKDGANVENEEAATAMALLAFQGAGFTPDGDANEPFTSIVSKGWKALLKKQDKNGNFFQDGSYNHTLYTQAQCTIALCELFGMTGDEQYREAAQRAVDYCVAVQTEQGGWKYQPGSGNDLSVTGWFVMALQSARMAGIEVPSPVFEKIKKFLDSVARANGSRYGYERRDGATLSMTAEGLLCRQYLGWPRDDERLQQGVYYLLDHLPRWRSGQRNVYYWYYATQVCHHMEGEHWDKWNSVMRQLLPANQETKGRDRGSWEPNGDRWGGQGGRLYVTCLSIYMLEVYYRHLPIYQRGLLDE